MRKLLTILILTGYLSSSTQLIEVLKLPILINHYFEHKAENKHITFIDFLKLHYAETKHYTQHHKEKQLPFKAIPQTAFNVVAINKTDFVESINYNSSTSNYIKHTAHYNSKCISFYTANIWQPPKNCKSSC